ncbi:unnamed protein product, partial [Rodentolepis nana]|uniref:Anoctamin n=1 Tax=Rodentolepis nana TaxID=102285 RepID=A0A0R3TT20_RODNA
FISRLLASQNLWVSVVVIWAGYRIRWVFSISSCRCFAKQSCPVRSLNSAMDLILGQSGMSESATVHCFSFVKALISLDLEVWNSFLIKAFIVWKDIGRSMLCKIVVPFLASVSASSLPLMPQISSSFHTKSYADESLMCWEKNIVGLKEPGQLPVNHPFHKFKPIVVKVARVFALFQYWYYIGNLVRYKTGLPDFVESVSTVSLAVGPILIRNSE